MSAKSISQISIRDILNIFHQTKYYILSLFLFMMFSLIIFINFKGKSYEAILTFKPHKLEIFNKFSEISLNLLKISNLWGLNVKIASYDFPLKLIKIIKENIINRNKDRM